MWKVFTFTLMIEQSVSKKFARCFLLKSNKVPIVFPSSSIVQLLKQDVKLLDTNLPISHTLEWNTLNVSVQPLPLRSYHHLMEINETRLVSDYDLAFILNGTFYLIGHT